VDTPARQRSILRLLLDLLRVATSSRKTRLNQRDRPPTQRVLDLTNEHPGANADLPALAPEPDHAATNIPDSIDLTDEPNDTRNQLNVEITFLGGRAKMSINGIGTPLYAAAAVFLLSLPTVFPIIVTPGHTGFIPAVVAFGWLGLSTTVVLLTFFAPKRSRTS